MDEFRHFSIWNIVVSCWSKFLLMGTGLCYQLDSFFLIRAIGLMMGLWWERCFLAASWQSQHLSVNKNKKIEKNNALEMVLDQTQLRSKTFLIRPKCAWSGYDQTQLRSKSALIRPKCTRIRLWSDFSDQIDLWSDHLLTIVQTFFSALELPSRPCSFGLWTHGCALDWVWS